MTTWLVVLGVVVVLGVGGWALWKSYLTKEEEKGNKEDKGKKKDR